ncbi:hypothetical protein A5882_003604 [Enterococcus sp. 4E1_DIV0656]|nr:hypothetical protein A5882_003604 [Enterococcus sp. 4E1_DIV0656]
MTPLLIVITVTVSLWVILGFYYFHKLNKEASSIKKSILEDKAKEILHGKTEGWEFMLSGVRTAAENKPLIKFINEKDSRPFRFYTLTALKTILVSPFLLIADVVYLFSENRPNT